MSMFDKLSEQAIQMAENQRDAIKTSSSFALSKILNKQVRISEKRFDTMSGKSDTHEGKVTDIYGDFIELDNNKLVSTKFISSIEIL